MVDKEPDFQPSEERNEWDMERIHELAGRLLPIYADIASGQVDDPKTQRYLNELTNILHDLHPADMATVLESLPQQERVMVWKLSEPDEDGEVLLEVSDAVRETLIESMGQRELLAAIEDLDADELAELAPDLPKEVVHEALESLDAEERAQVLMAINGMVKIQGNRNYLPPEQQLDLDVFVGQRGQCAHVGHRYFAPNRCGECGA